MNTKINNLIKTIKTYDIEVNEINSVNKTELYDKFPYKKLNKLSNNNFILIENLLSFLENENNKHNKTSNKVGLFPILIPLIYGIYNIEYLSEKNEYKIFYNYDWVKHIEIKPLIEAKRIAFSICDLVKKNITENFNNYLKVNFEVKIDVKVYDIVISLTENDKHLIIIEIQEDNNNHVQNQNDQDKYYIVNSKGYIMKWFNEKELINNQKYEYEFYVDIVNTAKDVLIATSDKFRNKNLIKETKIISRKEIEKLQNQLDYIDDDEQKHLINIDIESWSMLMDDMDESTDQIKKLYKYKIQAYENPNKTVFSDYNIPLDFILDNLKLKLNKRDVDYDILNKLRLRYCRTIKNKQYLSFNSMYSFIVEINLETVSKLKLHFTKIILSTQDIYENYIRIIQKYHDSIINKLQNDNCSIKNMIENNMNKKYENILEKNKIELQIKDGIIKLFKKMMMKKNTIKNISINLNYGSPIIKKIPIIFSEDYNKNINSIDALAILLCNGFKKRESKKLLNEFNNNFTNCKKLHFTEHEVINHLYYDSDLERTNDESEID